MQFGLSESQQILKNNARKFFAAECPMTEVRRLMETETAHDDRLWRRMAKQGFLGVVFGEDVGGTGLGIVELAALAEEMGRALVPGPFLSTLLAGAVMMRRARPRRKKNISGRFVAERPNRPSRCWKPAQAGTWMISRCRRSREKSDSLGTQAWRTSWWSRRMPAANWTFTLSIVKSLRLPECPQWI